jgi:hypothetical protein
MLPTGAADPAQGPTAPDFADGWYGYVLKDLRDLLNPLPAKSRCRTVRRRVRSHGRVRTRRVRVCPRAKPKRKEKPTAKRSRATAATSTTTATATATRAKPKRRRTRRAPKKKPKPPAVRGRYSRVYCGNGSPAACRAALLASLADALGVSHTDLYGTGACKSDPQASCFDKNHWTVASAISLPDFSFQNRPTFQQVVETTQVLPR